MAKEMKQDIVVGLDLGTTKVCTIIGEQDDDGQVHIIGVGTTPSAGLKKGSVVNIEETVASIKKSLQDAQRMAGVEVTSAYTGVAGGHIKGLNSRGVIAVSRKDKEIRKRTGRGSSRPPRPSPFPWTGRSSMSSPRNTSWTTRTASRTRWGCRGSVWKRKCTW